MVKARDDRLIDRSIERICTSFYVHVHACASCFGVDGLTGQTLPVVELPRVGRLPSARRALNCFGNI